MDIERILVFFESPDGKNLWKAVERENIPDWLRTPTIVDRLVAGELVRRAEDNPPRYFKVIEVDRPRPAGQHKLRVAAELANGELVSGIALPTMH